MSPLTVHTVRFYSVTPTAIHTLCPAPDGKHVALSRADNAIEVWDVKHAPVLRKWIPSNAESSVEALAWVGDRLFSAGLHGLILEHDLVTLATKQQFAVTSGPAWCMEYSKQRQVLAVGTEEGYVCLFKVTKEGLDYWKTLDKQEGRVLCLNWHSSGKYIVTGSPDTLRVWDVNTGSPTVRMTTGRVERNRETVVWSVALADDMTIVSGDSRGKTCFWNGKTGTLIDAYQTHKADVLTVAMHKKNNLALSSGVDPWIMHFQPVVRNDQRTKWVKSVHRWVHSHDVRALAFFQGKILSAGLDATLAVNDTSTKVAVRYMPKPQGQVAAVAKRAKLLLLRYDRHLELWKLGETEGDTESMTIGSFAPLAKEPVKVLTLKTKDKESIRTCHVSPDGGWVAYATATRMRVYSLEGVKSPLPSIQRATVTLGDEEELQLSHHLRFTSESKLVSVTEKGDLQMFHLEAQDAQLIDTISGSDLGLKGSVSLVEFKEGLTSLVLADYADNIVTFDVKTKKVASKAPLYQNAPVAALSLSYNGEALIVAYSDNHVVEVNQKTGRYTKFSNSLRMPAEFKKKKNATNGIVQLRSRARDVVIFYDDVHVCSIDRNDPLQTPPTKALRQSRQKKGSEEAAEVDKEPETKVKFTKKYESLLFMGALDEDSTLLALEVRPHSIEEQLPPSLKQKKFGAM